MSSSIDSRLTCVGTRSRQTSIHVPSPQPVSQERGAGEPVGLHHGPSLGRRRGRRREKKIKTRQWSCHLLRPGSPRLRRLLPRCAHSSSNSQRGCCACLRRLRLWGAKMRRAPRGLVPPAAPGGAHKPGWGDAQQVPLVGSRSEMQKRSLLPPGRAGSHDKMVPFWTRAAEARWQGQASGWPGPEEGAGPTGGRLRLAGARQPAGSWAGRSAAGASALTLTPTRAHSRLLLLLLQEAGDGWCIKGEAPPNRVSSPRTLSPAAVVAEAAAALCCSGAHAAANPHLGSEHPAPQVDVKSVDALFRPPSPPSATQLRAAFTPAPRVP